MNTFINETNTSATTEITPELWEWAVALAGKAVMGVVLGLGIASIYLDRNAQEGATHTLTDGTAEKDAIVDLASDAALHVVGIAEMEKLEDPLYESNWKDAGWAMDAIFEWSVWFGDDEDARDDIGFKEMVCLVEACRFRALRIMSRPRHREAVEALAQAILSPKGISGENAEKLVRVLIERETNAEDTTES